jgi:hypothetical protein
VWGSVTGTSLASWRGGGEPTYGPVMRSSVWIGLALVLGCGGGKQPAASAGSGSATGSAVAAGSAGSGSAPAPAAKLVEAAPTGGSSQPGGLELEPTHGGAITDAAFPDDTSPKLPALSADGTMIADWYRAWPSMAPPMLVARIGEPGATTLELLDGADGSALNETEYAKQPPPAAVVEHVQQRGAAIMKVLRDGGYETLVEVPWDQDKPLKLDGATLDAGDSQGIGSDPLVVTFADAAGNVLRKDRIDSFKNGTFLGFGDQGTLVQMPCWHSPHLHEVYRDRAGRRVFGHVYFHYHEECQMDDARWLAWTLPPSKHDAADITKALADQFKQVWGGPAVRATTFADDAQIASPAGLGTVLDPHVWPLMRHEQVTGQKDQNVHITLSRDGKTAWASLTSTLMIAGGDSNPHDDYWRASDVVVKTDAGWRIAAAAWTQPRDDADAIKSAKRGPSLHPATLEGDPGDAGLVAAFSRLVADGAGVATDDFIAIGSADERMVGGRAFATPWNAAWKGRAKVRAISARLAPSKTTGWVVARVDLPGADYTLPFLVFAVFDKNAIGWGLVHVQLTADA